MAGGKHAIMQPSGQCALVQTKHCPGQVTAMGPINPPEHNERARRIALTTRHNGKPPTCVLTVCASLSSLAEMSLALGLGRIARGGGKRGGTGARVAITRVNLQAKRDASSGSGTRARCLL